MNILIMRKAVVNHLHRERVQMCDEDCGWVIRTVEAEILCFAIDFLSDFHHSLALFLLQFF